MKILTKLMLASAVMVTSGFATTINESVKYQNGWDITGSDSATIVSEKTLTMQGESGGASNIEIKNTASLTNNGTIQMFDTSAIIVSSTADPACSNSGIIDFSNVTSFENYSVDIKNTDGAKIIIPAPNASVTAHPGSNFKFTAPATDGEELTIEYDAGNVSLVVDGEDLKISEAANGNYADLDAVKTALGVALNNEAQVSLSAAGGSMMMSEVIVSGANKSENSDMMFDLSQRGLSTREAELTGDTTIYFGLCGDAGCSLKLTGDYATTFLGDNVGLSGKISTKGDATFKVSASAGDIECGGQLIFNTNSSQFLNGEIKAGSLLIKEGTSLTFNKKVTTGWTALSYVLNFGLDSDSKIAIFSNKEQK